MNLTSSKEENIISDGESRKGYEDDSSVDTNDALMEMLGFSSSQCPESLNVAEITDEDETRNPETNSTCCISIKLPSKCSRYDIESSNCLALVLDNVLTQKDCNHIIQTAEKIGFHYITEATHKTNDGSFKVEIQKPNPHKLSAIDTHHSKDKCTLLMDDLYHKISKSLSSQKCYQSFLKRTKCGGMKGLNPRMRILKYDASDNDRFDAHFDATTYVPSIEKQRKSLITVLLYLNDGDGVDFEGGETVFLPKSFKTSTENRNLVNDENNTKVVPKTGSVCIFEHDLFHSGAPLHYGTKYIMRTDILYDNNETSTNENSGNSTKTGAVLVSEICTKLNVSNDVIQILRDMDLWDITCESLLAPGPTLKKMLLDCNLDEKCVTSLIDEANNVIRDK